MRMGRIGWLITTDPLMRRMCIDDRWSDQRRMVGPAPDGRLARLKCASALHRHSIFEREHAMHQVADVAAAKTSRSTRNHA
jgi:hypothetical protein